MPERVRVANEFIKPDLERALVAAIAAQPDLYWQVTDLIHPEALTVMKQTFADVAEAVEHGRPIPVVEGEPAPDPVAAAQEIADLYQRRLMGDMLQDLLQRLNGDTPASDLLASLDAQTARVQQAIRELRAGQMITLPDLFPAVIRQIAERHKAIKEQRYISLQSGLTRLDMVLGGFQPGIHVLAAEPGAGKTSLTLQIAGNVARSGYPVLFISFEESLDRLALKALCQLAELEVKRFNDGFGDPALLEKAAREHGPKLTNLHLIEGTPRTTPAMVKAKALQAMHRAGKDRCLIVVDYLQRWASSVNPETLNAMGEHQQRRAFMDFRHTVSALVSELRDLALRLDSPVLVISSQNRSGEGTGNLTSLKESGELEYSADTVLFLTKNEKRTVTPPARATDLEVRKNRYGDQGTIPLIFRPDVAQFREEAKR